MCTLSSAGPLSWEEQRAKGATWYFSFDLDISDVQNLGRTILDPFAGTLNAAAIISYALSRPMPGSSLTKVTVIGFIAARPTEELRGSTVQNWLSHDATRNLRLERITGDRRRHSAIKQFLSLPAAGNSASAPAYDFRVDLRAASDTPRNMGGRPRKKALLTAAPQAVSLAVMQPVLHAVAPGGADGAGLPLWPQPTAPSAQAEQSGGLPAAETGQRDPTDGSQRPPIGTQPQQNTAGANGPSASCIEQLAHQSAFHGPGGQRSVRDADNLLLK
jgi:hypothetical protein